MAIQRDCRVERPQPSFGLSFALACILTLSKYGIVFVTQFRLELSWLRHLTNLVFWFGAQAATGISRSPAPSISGSFSLVFAHHCGQRDANYGYDSTVSTCGPHYPKYFV